MNDLTRLTKRSLELIKRTNEFWRNRNANPYNLFLDNYNIGIDLLREERYDLAKIHLDIARTLLWRVLYNTIYFHEYKDNLERLINEANARLKTTLRKKSKKSKKKITIRTNIPASIYIDGEYKGKTPLTVEIPKGWHTLEIRKDGYYPIKEEINVTKDETLTFKLKEDLSYIRKLIRSNDLNKAYEVAKKMGSTYLRTWALCEVAKAYAKVGKIDEAKKILDEINLIKVKDDSLRLVAEAYAKIGRFDKANEIAKMIVDPCWRSEALGSIVESRKDIEKGSNSTRMKLFKGEKLSIELAEAL